VIDEELPVGSAAAAFTEDDRLRDPELGHRLDELVAALVSEAATALPAAA
jgi:hypothetical protein